MNAKHKYQSNSREVSLEEIVKAWEEGQRWAYEIINDLGMYEGWDFITALVNATTNKDLLAYIGAGPMEDLLYGNSEDYIDRVEEEAAKSENFRYSLSIVRNPELILRNPDRAVEIQQRIAMAIQGNTSHTSDHSE